MKQKSREVYRKKVATRKPIRGASLSKNPKCKEVADSKGNVFNEEVFSIPEAAEALGKSLLTFRRWVAEGLIPPPILHCVSRNYDHYSKGEIEVIAKGLAAHYKELHYLHSTHTETINRICQAVEGLRRISKSDGE